MRIVGQSPSVVYHIIGASSAEITLSSLASHPRQRERVALHVQVAQVVVVIGGGPMLSILSVRGDQEKRAVVDTTTFVPHVVIILAG